MLQRIRKNECAAARLDPGEVLRSRHWQTRHASYALVARLCAGGVAWTRGMQEHPPKVEPKGWRHGCVKHQGCEAELLSLDNAMWMADQAGVS